MSTSTPTRPRTRIRRWTYADYCRIPADRFRHEIIDGRHFVTPAPSPNHQEVSGNLNDQLRARIRKTGLGRVLYAPLDVHLGRGTVVQPDLVVVLARNEAIIGPKKLTGAPDLLVEVLSPSTKSRDRKGKLRRYERAGVREYWIVDPETHIVEQYVLRNGKYGPPTVSGERIRLRILRGITIDLREVW
jgi:Uma2 family endonuclease